MCRSKTIRMGRHLRDLSRALPLWVDDVDAFFIVSGLKLPPGYNVSHTDTLIELPPDYPLSPPGVGDYRVYLPPSLRFNRRKLKDLHEERTPNFDTPGFGPWAWFCYEYVGWSPECDDLIKFVEMVRADMTSPRTHGRFFS